MAKPRIRLPIVSERPVPPAPASCHTEPTPERSPLQWTALTTVAIMLVWTPLAILALWTVRAWVLSSAGSLDPAVIQRWFANMTWTEGVVARAMTMGLPVGAFLVSCGAVGAIVGRWSDAPGRAIGYAGTSAGAVAWLVGAVRTGLAHALPTLLMAGLFGFASSWTGHYVGARFRERSQRIAKKAETKDST